MAGIIKVNQYQDFNGNTLFTSDGNGNLTTMKTNYPAFEAYLSASQAPSNNTFTKVNINTEDYDTDNCYDSSTNYRFTPTVAGKYYVYAKVRGQSETVTKLIQTATAIYKNGSLYTESRDLTANSFTRALTTNVSTVIDMNGSSDYLEVYGLIQVDSGNIDGFIGGSSRHTLFGAYRIGS